MKKQLMLAVLALTLGGALPASTFANKHDMTPAEREKKLDKMASELNLSQDQKNKVRTIKEEKHSKIEEAMREADEKIRGVLTPEQQAKFDKMKEKK